MIPIFIPPQVKKKYQNMPFNLRNFEEEAKAKMGVVECVSHKLIEPFQVLFEKNCKLSMIYHLLHQARKIPRFCRFKWKSCPDTLQENQENH